MDWRKPNNLIHVSGFMFIRPTPPSLKLYKDTIAFFKSHKKIDDQDAMRNILPSMEKNK